jgi:SAM-dependent methyltransferase
MAQKEYRYRTVEAARLAQSRLYPDRISPRYYMLSELRQRFSELISTYHAELTGATLIDLGCGAMPYRSLFAPVVANYIGADLPDNPEADLVIPADGRLPLAAASVDVVLSSQALEHVFDPSAYLAEAWRILRPGGLLILSTHGYWIYHPHPTDYWRWTGSGLQKVISDAGFMVQQIEGVMGLAATALHLFQDALHGRARGPLRPAFGVMMQRAVALADTLYTPAQRRSDACIYVVVARRPSDFVQ